ncbi:MAG TPA: glucose-6-phosphate dehydrogenase [Acidimicrobiales bacterium]|nr:glucose-6-phosphate dehydrogenase [Acidimicrobiales bacterium]
MSETGASPADALVIFGITGDLARKMTLPALYRLEAGGHLDCPIVGVARDDWSEAHLVTEIQAALQSEGEAVEDKVFDRLIRRLSYLPGDFADPATFEALACRLKDATRPLFYLEVPPELFGPVVASLGKAGLTANSQVMIEKPFGHDLGSARKLNEDLHQVLAEDQILRIDHFLGKQPVMDVAFLRFANAMFEPVWNRDHIASVQVSLIEDFGVEDRGGFYDAVGALRDVVQNHLLQTLALITMESPIGSGSAGLWDRKVEVFRALADADPARCVRGQYEGYCEVPGVKPDSVTETYVALRLEVENRRWAGVPFFVRAGKAMAALATEVRVIFHRPPPLAFLEQPNHPDANQLVFRIDPDAALRLVMASKGPEGRSTREVHLDLPFAAELGQPPGPYERLLRDALVGDPSLFTREDAVEETWRVLQPLVDHPPAPVTYPRGSWGPAAADELVRGHPPWQQPWLSEPQRVRR